MVHGRILCVRSFYAGGREGAALRDRQQHGKGCHGPGSGRRGLWHREGPEPRGGDVRRNDREDQGRRRGARPPMVRGKVHGRRGADRRRGGGSAKGAHREGTGEGKSPPIFPHRRAEARIRPASFGRRDREKEQRGDHVRGRRREIPPVGQSRRRNRGIGVKKPRNRKNENGNGTARGRLISWSIMPRSTCCAQCRCSHSV
mmetsp:Transcript_14800/g.34395  ORF Transcript_14800/g.34395 Transcript_14800/m.34395 type:complete len:201 (-) Transcript_14800:60-662(-)